MPMKQILARFGNFYQELHRRCLAEESPPGELPQQLHAEPLVALTTVAISLSLITVLATPAWYAATWCAKPVP
jgi:hypothetical protein